MEEIRGPPKQMKPDYIAVDDDDTDEDVDQRRLDSASQQQPLNDLIVGVREQDELERDVMAKVVNSCGYFFRVRQNAIITHAHRSSHEH